MIDGEAVVFRDDGRSDPASKVQIHWYNSFGLEAKLIDKGDRVDVVDSHSTTFTFFRTKEACEQAKAARELNFKRSLDPYR
jgi:hypothetical protein